MRYLQSGNVCEEDHFTKLTVVQPPFLSLFVYENGEMPLHAGRRPADAVSVQAFDGVGWDFGAFRGFLDEEVDTVGRL